MSATSRAAVLLGERSMEIREFALPEIKDDDGLLRVEATGVCGSDIAAYHAGSSMFYELPCVLGHELVGRVERIGDAAAQRWGIGVGDRIVVEEYLPCGTCDACLDGAYQMCAVRRYGGRSVDSGSGLWGGYSDYLYLDPQSIVHRVAEDVPAELVQLYIPISNGLHWVQGVGAAKPGDTVVIIGPGPHGLGCVVGAKETGAGQIVMVGQERDRARLDVASALGADHVLTGGADEVGAALSELTGGRMAQTVVNAADSSAALATALAAAGDRATIVQVGLAHGGSVDIDVGAALATALVERVLSLRGVRGRPSSLVPGTLRLIESGRYPLELMNTGTFGVEETEAALNSIAEDPAAIRSVVVPSS
jgi:threonine dehydrogenase-like Zn-dependent dehydrogenase